MRGTGPSAMVAEMQRSPAPATELYALGVSGKRNSNFDSDDGFSTIFRSRFLTKESGPWNRWTLPPISERSCSVTTTIRPRHGDPRPAYSGGFAGIDTPIWCCRSMSGCCLTSRNPSRDRSRSNTRVMTAPGTMMSTTAVRGLRRRPEFRLGFD